MSKKRLKVLSGMRPTGALHLGHYHGVLKNWLQLQEQYQCYFFIADWHALTTHYEDHLDLEKMSIELMIDFLSVGMNPDKATFFIQSHVKEHAELALLLSMTTPLSWLERVPSYKDLQQSLCERNLLNVGFLYYPLLQAADILAYKADIVPVGEDQVAHIELAREIARRFNDTYGKPNDFLDLANHCISQINHNKKSQFVSLRKEYLENGNSEALNNAKLLIDEQDLSDKQKQILRGYLENQGQMILNSPKSMLTETCKLPGLDGQKMSKSYNNTIFLREKEDDVSMKIRKMKTDPARVRKTDAGDPKKCPVFDFHKVYSSKETQQYVTKGCTNATIGCLECKSPLIDSINSELSNFRKTRNEFNDNKQILDILKIGAEKARDEASKTLKEVKSAIKIAQ